MYLSAATDISASLREVQTALESIRIEKKIKFSVKPFIRRLKTAVDEWTAYMDIARLLNDRTANVPVGLNAIRMRVDDDTKKDAADFLNIFHVKYREYTQHWGVIEKYERYAGVVILERREHSDMLRAAVKTGKAVTRAVKAVALAGARAVQSGAGAVGRFFRARRATKPKRAKIPSAVAPSVFDGMSSAFETASAGFLQSALKIRGFTIRTPPVELPADEVTELSTPIRLLTHSLVSMDMSRLKAATSIVSAEEKTRDILIDFIRACVACCNGYARRS